MVVYDDNYTTNIDDSGYNTRYIGGGFPYDKDLPYGVGNNPGVGYTITGSGVPPNTIVTNYRYGRSSRSNRWSVLYINLNNAVSGDTFCYSPPQSPSPSE
jgi:hypothetical protein